MTESNSVRALRAYRQWATVFKKDIRFDTVFEFAAFLGDPHVEGRVEIINFKSPEVMEKVDLILGPNWYTILKMIAAKNGSNADDA